VPDARATVIVRALRRVPSPGRAGDERNGVGPMRRTRGILGGALLVAAAMALVGCSSGSVFGGQSLGTVAGSCHPVTATPPVPLTLVRANGGTTPIVPVCIGGAGPYPFVLDTGAAASFVDSQLAKSLNLASAPSRSVALGIGCVTTTNQVAVGSWSLGGIPLAGQPLGTASVPGFGGSGSPAGVLGSDVLGRFGAIRIDYRARMLTVLAPEAAAPTITRIYRGQGAAAPPPLLVHQSPKAAALLTVLRSSTTAFVASDTVFGTSTPYPFVVASGSPLSVIEQATASHLALASTGSSVPAPNVGCQGSAKQVRSGTWTVGTVPQTPRALATVSLAGGTQNAVPGDIGSDVLSSWGSVVLDYRTAVLWLGAG
jgi:Aspartyl protease